MARQKPKPSTLEQFYAEARKSFGDDVHSPGYNQDAPEVIGACIVAKALDGVATELAAIRALLEAKKS